MPYTTAPDAVWPVVRKYFPIVANDLWAETDHLHFDFMESTRQGGMEAVLSAAIRSRKWMTASGHGIRTALGRAEEAARDFLTLGKKWDGFGPIEYSVLDAFFSFARSRQDSVFIGTYRYIGRYQIERRNSAIRIIDDQPARLTFAVVNSLDPQVYDYPLTLKIPAWLGIFGVSQAGIAIPVTQRGSFKIFDVAPNGGDIVLSVDPSGISRRAMPDGLNKGITSVSVSQNGILRYTLPRSTSLTLSLFTLHGQRAGCHSFGKMPAGSHETCLPFSKGFGTGGIYLYSLKTETGSAQGSILFLP